MCKFLACVLAAAMLTGCWKSSNEVVVSHMGQARLDKGLVVVLPGIEGRSQLNEAICEGLNDGGVTAAIDLEDWTSSVPMNLLYNQRNSLRNREQAEIIADRIMRYKMSYPNRPVILVGQSGGGAMAAWIVEALPPAESVDGVIMLAASLSPQYPLDTALAKSRRGIVNFHSSKDWFILGVGTTISGTMDGEHTSSAGRVGFESPTSGPRARLYYQKLRQVAWQESMAQTGYTGNHLTSGTRLFVSNYVAPLVLQKTWDREAVAALGRKHPSTSPAASMAQRSAGARTVAAAPSPTTPVATATPSPSTRPAPARPSVAVTPQPGSASLAQGITFYTTKRTAAKVSPTTVAANPSPPAAPVHPAAPDPTPAPATVSPPPLTPPLAASAATATPPSALPLAIVVPSPTGSPAPATRPALKKVKITYAVTRPTTRPSVSSADPNAARGSSEDPGLAKQ
ncbi:MAG: hypothetical protein WC869_15115 [Phycisphaerae bacterium]|jgi:hypothetical protein